MPTVTIRRNFCPSCFRGQGVETARVPLDSACIDEEQREFSKLPLLDLPTVGARCKAPRCRQICLACGNPMAFPCEPDYDEALDAVDQYEEDVLELRTEVLEGMGGLMGSLGESMLKDAERRLQRRLRKLGMAWHPRWRTAVHAGCVKKEACGCVLTVYAGGCKAHPVKRRLAPRPAPQKIVQSMPEPPPRQELRGPSYSRPVVVERCSWLPKPSSTTAVQLAKTHPTVVQPAPRLKGKPPPAKPNLLLKQAAKGCGRLDAWKDGPATPAPPPAPVTPPKKKAKPTPSMPAKRLKQAAKGCTKLDGWSIPMERAPKPAPRPAAAPSAAPEQAQPVKPRIRPPFDRARHERDFDPFLHGVFRKNGVELFRFPDGWVEPVPAPVFRITDDGHLVPG